MAEIIFHKTQNNHTCFIQWADKYNPELKEPVLWEYNAWMGNTERWERQKRRSDMERIERNLLEANVKLVSRAWSEYSQVPLGANTEIVAYSMLKQKREKAIRVFYVGKLITKEEEL